MLSVLRCPNCSAPVDAPKDGHSVCPYCGATLVETQPAKGRIERSYSLKLRVGPSNVARVARLLHDALEIEVSEAQALLARSPCEVSVGADWSKAKAIANAVEQDVGGQAEVVTHTITTPCVDVVLDEVGPKKLAVIVVIREHVELGIAEAKRLVEAIPAVVVKAMDEPLALELVAALEAAGARASVR